MGVGWEDKDHYERVDDRMSSPQNHEEDLNLNFGVLARISDFFRDLVYKSNNMEPFRLHDFRVAFPAQLASKEEEMVKEYKDDFDFLVSNPNYGDLYKRVILNGNLQSLEKKTQRQAVFMRQAYFGDSKKGSSEHQSKLKKLADFRAFTQFLRPIHTDGNYFQRYKSPFALGKLDADDKIKSINRLTFEQNYVYASFDGVGYEGAYGGYGDSPIFKYAEGVSPSDIDDVELDEVLKKYASPVERRAFNHDHYIDEFGLQKKAEVAMMDLHELRLTADKTNQVPIKLFLDNLFDYKGSREILALYFAMVFETVDEAKKFLKENVGPEKAERFYPRPKNQKVIPINDGEAETDRVSGEYPKTKEIFDKFGIVPPLNLEVRIRDYADVAYASRYFNPRLVKELAKLGIIIPKNRIKVELN